VPQRLRRQQFLLTAYRLYSFVLCKLRKDIEFVGESRLCIHPSTRLIMNSSRIVIEDGLLSIGIPYLLMEFDAKKDNCRINLTNSLIRIIGKVCLYPGCRILAVGGLLVVRNGTIMNGAVNIFINRKVEIGEHCLFARGVTVTDSDWHKHAIGSEKPKEMIKEVIIEDHCWIGQNAIILKGVTIGEGAVVGAHSVVTRDVPPRTMVAGNPARVLKENVVWEL